MISSRSNLLDSFVILYATFVGALHRIVGLEFGTLAVFRADAGAHFVHTLVSRYNALTINPSTSITPQANIYETPDGSKESLNLLTLISELYNAGVIACGLIYDLVRGFLNENDVMSETAVESLLKVLRCMWILNFTDFRQRKPVAIRRPDKSKGYCRNCTGQG